MWSSLIVLNNKHALRSHNRFKCFEKKNLFMCHLKQTFLVSVNVLAFMMNYIKDGPFLHNIYLFYNFDLDFVFSNLGSTAVSRIFGVSIFFPLKIFVSGNFQQYLSIQHAVGSLGDIRRRESRIVVNAVR